MPISYKPYGEGSVKDDIVKATIVMINLGNAVYRDNMIWTQSARGHGAIVWKFDGPLTYDNLFKDTLFRIIEIPGPTNNRTLSTITGMVSYPPRGCYTNPSINYVQRLKVLKTALSISGGMGYPSFGGNVLEPKNTWDGNLDTITHLRCDGLIEVVYEINGIKVWGMCRGGDNNIVHYDISNQDDYWDYNPILGIWKFGSNGEYDNQEEHNDFDFSVWFIGDWDDTLMPATQAGYVNPDNAETQFRPQNLCMPIGSTGGNS